MIRSGYICGFLVFLIRGQFGSTVPSSSFEQSTKLGNKSKQWTSPTPKKRDSF